MAWSVDLFVRALVALATGLVYAYVARIVLSRKLTGEAHAANVSFAIWWCTFGLVEFLAAAYTLPAAFGFRDLALAVTLLNVLLVLIAVAIGGLVYYLVYLYTGSARWRIPIVAAYSTLAVGLIYLIAWMQPIGFDESQGAGTIAYARRLTGAPAVAVGLSLSVPVILAAIAYGSLYWRTQDPAPRFRIAMIAGSFGGWFLWSAISTAMQLAQRFPNSRWLLAVNSAVALAAPLLVVAAYRPPGFVTRRLEQREEASLWNA